MHEVLTTFFIEVGFLGGMLFGWSRFCRDMHMFFMVMAARGTLVSSF